MKIETKIIRILALACAALMIILTACASNDAQDSDETKKPRTTKRPQKTEAVSESVTVETTKTPLQFAKEPLELELQAPQAFVYDVNSNEFLYLKGEGETIYPASTTKLVAIIYALTLVEPDEVETVGDELSLLGEHPSLALISEGHRLTVEMLIEGMLLPSGNDAAYTLAAAAGRRLAGDPDMSGADAAKLFVTGMNDYAHALGMTGSNFTSPDGYFDANHYSTVEDMALISAIAVKNEIIAKYARKLTDKVTFASGQWIEWTNTNKLIDPWSGYYSPYATGLKTGSLDNNYCLVASANIEGVDYVIGVFSETDANARFEDALIAINALEGRLS